MAFTHALYYPWIDIIDSEWLKTAILYWDKISTIVPINYGAPYQNLDTAYLAEEGIIDPIYVDPLSLNVKEASEEFLNYLSTDEAKNFFYSQKNETDHKGSLSLENNNDVAWLNKYKLNKKLYERLKKSGKIREKGEWLSFDKDSINYYMTILASKIALEKHYSPLTNDQLIIPLANRVKSGFKPRSHNQYFNECLLVKCVFESVTISANTSLDKILDFRRKYSDELGLFRTEIGVLAQSIDQETKSSEGLEQQFHDLFINKINPSLNMLKKALNGNNIHYFTSCLYSYIFLPSIFFSISDLALRFTIGATAGFLVNTIKFDENRKLLLHQNPYSYLLHVNEEL